VSQRLQELERRLQFDPAPFVVAQLADEYCRVGRYDDAIACCRRLLDRHPAYFTARVVLGRALAAVGRWQEAAVELEHVLAAAPDHLTAIRDLGDVYERLDRRVEALQCYRRALELSRDDAQLQSVVTRLSSPGAEPPPTRAIVPAPSRPVDFDALLARLGHPNQPVPPLVETLLTRPERLLSTSLPGAPLSPATAAAVRSLENWLAALARDRAAS
jgi:tetratricopeptide (TPR) repeat protein